MQHELEALAGFGEMLCERTHMLLLLSFCQSCTKNVYHLLLSLHCGRNDASVSISIIVIVPDFQY